MTTAIINIGTSHDGGPDGAPIPGDALVCDGDAIAWIGDSAEVSTGDHRSVVDAAGATVVPGWIDSHVHTTFGDYTPRQQTIGFLDSYLHGGTTRAISASEVHTPGRPKDVVGVKALAIAAQRCFQDYRPSGVTVHAGSVILEPGLTREDFRELREAGVWMAKGGFGAFEAPEDYAPIVHAATAEGILVMCHTGGGSIPGSLSKIGADALLAMRPTVAGHVNGGPTSLARAELERLTAELPDMALQLVQAGNLRSAIDICELALEADDFHRILVATDTPTGTGVIPLGMIRQMAELVSLGPLSARQAISASTGNVGEVYGLDAGRLEVGRPADVLVIDAPIGGQADDAFGALELGDLPAVVVAITQGEIRFTKSRNTPTAVRAVQLVS
ncbi:MAG: amidohydrolase family protein [Nitriliruptoraceae bacterium]|nr:amidohydrolase family protein [Nitriliruptoraceae bacterium]